jgi:hypothetical protein
LVNNTRQHGGTIAAGGVLAIQNANVGTAGTIYYTTDGSDPRLVGGAVNAASAQVFSGSIALSGATQVKVRILRNGEWSALTQATFTPVVDSADFNSDGMVDGGDFLAWQRGYGHGSAPSQGNADGDQDVDQGDLSVWKAQFGQSTATLVTMSSTSPAQTSFVHAVSDVTVDSVGQTVGAKLITEAGLLPKQNFSQVSGILQSRAAEKEGRRNGISLSVRDQAFNEDCIDKSIHKSLKGDLHLVVAEPTTTANDKVSDSARGDLDDVEVQAFSEENAWSRYASILSSVRQAAWLS